jgi:hypothetical protein
MPLRQRVAYLILVIVVVVAPTVLALGWYQISRDPNFRPLGVTQQALRAYSGGGDGVEIVAVVDWAPARSGGYTRAQLMQALSQSFAAKGVEVRIELRSGHPVTQVTYIVGKTVLGPFGTTQAAEGIAAAVEAYHMH